MLRLKCLYLLVILILLENASAWTSFEDLGGGVNHVAVASWGPGRIDVFGTAEDGVWHKAYANGAWGGYENLGGYTKLKPSAFSIKPNWIDIVYTGTDQMLYRKTWNGNSWINWRKATNGGIFVSGPTITGSLFDASNLHVFGVSTDKKLYHSVVDVTTNQGSTWENLGGSCVGDPAAVSWGTNRFDIFSVFPDGLIWQKTWDNGWIEWKALSGGSYKPGVGAATKGPGMISVFGVGLNNGIYTRSFVSGQWNDLEFVGGSIRSSAAAVTTGSTRVEVFGVGLSDAKVWRSVWDNKDDVQTSNYGCYRGYCWAKCSTTFVDVISSHEWCYTTKGSSQDYNYVKCGSYQNCGYNWKCAGSCTV